MKICEFCDSVNPDEVEICSSCGGNSFQYKCNNCGTLFKEGVYCPHCGVKAGQTAKSCPRCGTQYFSNACPSCGYLPGTPQNVPDYSQPQAATKRHTALWVLGWIFLTPVPITILVVRSKTLQNWLKALIILAVWGIYLFIGLSGAAEDNEDTALTSSAVPPVTVSEESEPPQSSLVHGFSGMFFQ